MKVSTYLRSLDVMVHKTIWTLASNTILAVAIVFLALTVMNKEPIVAMVPPNLTEEATVGAKTANAEYLMSWGLYFASMTGNVTPKNVLFVADSIGSITDPDLYPALRRQLYSLAADPIFNERGGSVSFEAQDVSYDAPSNKVFVTGDQISRTSAGDQNRARYVYEIQVEIRNHRPVVVAVDHYEGAPRTAKWMRDAERSRHRKEKKAPAQEAQAEPWFDEGARFGVPAKQIEMNVLSGNVVQGEN